jgi:hypothetical protein
MKTALKLPPPEGNSLEQAFSLRLEARKQAGEILWHRFQPLRLRIGKGGRGMKAYYKPDFSALTPDGDFILYETKGQWREASRVRIRVAAEIFPFFKFIAVTKTKDGWEYEEF